MFTVFCGVGCRSSVSTSTGSIPFYGSEAVSAGYPFRYDLFRTLRHRRWPFKQAGAVTEERSISEASEALSRSTRAGLSSDPPGYPTGDTGSGTGYSADLVTGDVVLHHLYLFTLSIPQTGLGRIGF